MSRWGHCGFILLIARKEFNLVTSEFPHLHNWKCALVSLFFCWRTKERKWLFSPNTHTLVTIPTEAGRELDNGSCRCGGIFSNPLCCCCLTGSRDRAMEDQERLLDWSTASISVLQSIWWSLPVTASPSLYRAVAEAEFPLDRGAKPGKGSECFGWVRLSGNLDFCGERLGQPLPSPQAVNASAQRRARQGWCSHPKLSGQTWGGLWLLGGCARQQQVVPSSPEITRREMCNFVQALFLGAFFSSVCLCHNKKESLVQIWKLAHS